MAKTTENTENIQDTENVAEDVAEVENVETTPEAESKASEKAPEKAEEKVEDKEDYGTKYLYLAAEMQNLRNHLLKEKEEHLKYGHTDLFKSLLEVLDNFDRSLEAIQNEKDGGKDNNNNKKMKSVIQGIEMIKNQFFKVLTDNGLKEVEALGTIFDPKFHEAMAQQPAKGKKEQEVITVYRKGYLLNGRLIRAAQVVVAKND